MSGSITNLPFRNQFIPTVCDIRSFLLLNLFCGYYVPVFASKKHKVLLIIYCLLAFTFNIFCTSYCCIDSSLSIAPILETVELIFLYSISYHTQFKYLTDYYNLVPITDIASNSNKYFYFLQVLVNTTTILFVVIYLFVLLFFITYFNFCSHCGIWGIVMKTLHKFTAELGRFPIILVFYLLYCRVRMFRTQLMTEGFVKFGTRWYPKKKYIDMYISICDGLSKLDYPLKYMVR